VYDGNPPQFVSLTPIRRPKVSPRLTPSGPAMGLIIESLAGFLVFFYQGWATSQMDDSSNQTRVLFVGESHVVNYPNNMLVS